MALAYPAGVALLASAFLVHHDPEIYPEPYAFRPERFLGNDARDVYVDPIRRRPQTVPRRELRDPGDEDRAAGRARALRADARER